MVTASDVGSHKLQQRMTNTNNNHSMTVAAPLTVTAPLTHAAPASLKTENLHEVKEKEAPSSKPSEKLKDKSPSTTIPAPSDTADILNKVKSSLENLEQSSFTFSEKLITSPVTVSPEPPVKPSTISIGKVSSSKKSHSGEMNGIIPACIRVLCMDTGGPTNPWPKFNREIQRCLNSLDRLNDELNRVQLQPINMIFINV